MIHRRHFTLASLSLAACGGGAPPDPTQPPLPPVSPAPITAPAVSTDEAWRPHYHYTPRRNWMNDPNGLVYFDGEYHLFYQYNPLGTDWGQIGWGHAVSLDLVSWQELPMAIEATSRLMAFSGSVVVDHDNSAGFAPAGAAVPALLAFFTGFDPASKNQSQHLAYSLDRGRSFTAYAGNPVIDIGSTEFRDPKVFWHGPSRRWVMLVVAALAQQVWFYSSQNLRDWVKVSSFGPAGSAANNIWEVPDLFELAIDGDALNRRWVLVVSVNHGAIWGGSGVQYFIGSFDGSHFTAEASNTVDALTPPAGDLIADFEGGRLPPGWRVEGTAFGATPVAGALAGQQYVSGHLGRGLMNSFHGGDASTGRLISPEFTITRRHISFLIAGGRSGQTRLELVVDGQVVRQSSGDDTEVLKWTSWDTAALIGHAAVLRAVDEASGAWGHLLIDHIVMTDAPVAQPDAADITLWADHGRDFYAPLTFANLPDGRVLWLGWMSNWAYARALPTQAWRGQQSCVRQLDLVTTARGLRLRQQMAPELLAWLAPQPVLSLGTSQALAAAAALAAKAPSGRQWRARLVVAASGLLAPIGFELFRGGGGQALRAGYDPARKAYFIDRRSGTPKFDGESERHDAARAMDGAQIDIEVWTDGSTVELLADGGTVAISDLAYPDPAATGVALFHGAENPALVSLALQAVRAAMA